MLFRGKVYCSVCGKKHKFKKRAKKPTYVCSTYDNYGADTCERNQIDEEDIIWLVSGHFNIEEDDITKEFVDNNIEKVIAEPNKTSLTVHYRTGEQSLLSSRKIIR